MVRWEREQGEVSLPECARWALQGLLLEGRSWVYQRLLLKGKSWVYQRLLLEGRLWRRERLQLTTVRDETSRAPAPKMMRQWTQGLQHWQWWRESRRTHWQ